MSRIKKANDFGNNQSLMTATASKLVPSFYLPSPMILFTIQQPTISFQCKSDILTVLRSPTVTPHFICSKGKVITTAYSTDMFWPSTSLSSFPPTFSCLHVLPLRSFLHPFHISVCLSAFLFLWRGASFIEVLGRELTQAADNLHNSSLAALEQTDSLFQVQSIGRL